MLFTALCSVIAVAAAGLTVKWLLDRSRHPAEITWQEFAIGMAVAAFVITPLVAWIGFNVARSNNVTFSESWNGWELSVVKQDITCTRDGPCANEYNCDPYLCNPHSCNCRCTSRDDKGSCTSESCDTCWDTCYHDCPYTTIESNYIVQTTLGNVTISSYRFPENPQAHRWRKSVAVPQSLIARVGEGIPAFWNSVKVRIDNGAPGPVSIRKNYENYILASDRTILKQYSSDLAKFREANILPPVPVNIHDFYLADKVMFIGYQPENPDLWQSTLRYLNAALGSELQGDLHLVVVGAKQALENPDLYTLVLRAHWQDRRIFGRNCLSKNGIAVIAGTADGKTVAWARAFTGMPVGNEALTVAVRNKLKGTPLDPSTVIGAVRGEFYAKAGLRTARGVHGNGALEKILWGLTEPATKFSRVSMKAQDKDDVGTGYLYLLGEIELTSKQQTVIGVIEFIASLFIWLAAALIGERRRRNW